MTNTPTSYTTSWDTTDYASPLRQACNRALRRTKERPSGRTVSLIFGLPVSAGPARCADIHNEYVDI